MRTGITDRRHRRDAYDGCPRRRRGAPKQGPQPASMCRMEVVATGALYQAMICLNLDEREG